MLVKDLRLTDVPEEKAKTKKRSNTFMQMENIHSRLKELSKHQEYKGSKYQI